MVERAGADPVRIVITCNGPGETAGWLRPLLREVFGLQQQADVHVFYVPDDYATGREAAVVRELFPQAHVYEPAAYVKVAIGARVDGTPNRADVVLYLGGDLLHAYRLQRRFGGKFATYKFARRRKAGAIARAFAVDDANAAQFAACGVPRDRIVRAGNLAVDGALLEAACDVPPHAPADGIVIMPGSRPYEVRNLVPFFFSAALAMRRLNSQIPIAFGISPFTLLREVGDAVRNGGDPRFFAAAGTLIETADGAYLSSRDRDVRFAILRNAMGAARPARLALTIPGTKVIELAALGKPVLSCTPMNAPELAAFNGPLTYLDRIPVFGARLKSAAATAYARRFPYHTQPNIDAQEAIVRELHGTLTPGRVAKVALQCAGDSVWLERTAKALSGLYREHVGAARRMAAGILALRDAAE